MGDFEGGAFEYECINLLHMETCTIELSMESHVRELNEFLMQVA